MQRTFNNNKLALMLRWRRADIVLDTSMGLGVVLEKAKGKIMVAASDCQVFKDKQMVVSLSFSFK